MSDGDIVVEIEKETPIADDANKTGATMPPENPAIADLKAQHDELQAEKERERAAKEAAQRDANTARERAAAAERELETSRGEVAETRLGTVEQGLSAAQTEASAAEAAYAQAMTDGNFAEAAKQQRRMARAEAESVRLTEAKADLEAVKIQPREQRQQQVRQETQPSGDPVETFLSKCNPETAKWLRAHPEDARVLATQPGTPRAMKLNAAHSDALAEGIVYESPEYFAHVEKFLGPKVAAKPANGSGNGAQRRTPSAPVAPVGSDAGGSPLNGGNAVRLTAGEARAAQDGTLQWNYDDPSPQKRFKKGDPIGIQEMARRKQAMEKEGRYDPMNFIQS
jgi:hypothetical protein